MIAYVATIEDCSVPASVCAAPCPGTAGGLQEKSVDAFRERAGGLQEKSVDAFQERAGGLHENAQAFSKFTIYPNQYTWIQTGGGGGDYPT